MKRRPSTALLRPLRERLHRAPQFRGRRQVVQLTWIAIDVLAMLAAAHLVSDVLHRPMTGAVWQAFGIAVAVRIAAFIRFGMYRAALRYSGVHVLAITVTGIGLGSAVGLAAGWIGGNLGTLGLGRAFVLFEALVSMALCGGLRFAAGLVLEPRWSEGAEPVLIYGAGDFGEATLRNLGRHGSYRPVGLLDDAPHKHGLTIHGPRVLGGLAQLPAILERTHPTAVFVAITDLRDETARTIARACQAAGVYVYLVRSVDASRGSLRLRDLRLEDLLPRPSRKLDLGTRAGDACRTDGPGDRAGGSIGTELCRQTAAAGATELVLLDHSEFNLYQVEAELHCCHQEVRTVALLDNLHDAQRL
jgi:FlaA1/EpsC-like NDP-sugar epimerase